VTGFVYLVGAGPGDPRLLTMRAYELLRSADVVAHDELISTEILALAPPDAELLAVGRRAGRGATEYKLHPEVLARARAGRHVVRLKQGDPLVFGRGAEEAEELAAAGVGFEIVPGISAALGAAAYAGIPLTDRRHAGGVHLSSGHQPVDAPSRTDTLVLYMATRRLDACLARLVDEGWPPSTPAAWIAAATTPSQRVIVGTIADLRVPAGSAPALLIVGEVVALRSRLQWFEQRALTTRRIVVGRTRAGRSVLAAQLRALGAEVLEAPPFDRAIDLVALPCSASAHLLDDHPHLRNPPVVAIGPQTEAAAREAGAREIVRATPHDLDGVVGAVMTRLAPRAMEAAS
jgi:uroporphyrinogen III methyltransferase/synthase